MRSAGGRAPLSPVPKPAIFCYVTDRNSLAQDSSPAALLASIRNAIAVPDAAILRDDENQPFVYVTSGSNQFGRRQIEIGESQNQKTQILRGLSPGEKIVGDGSLFLQFANSLQH